MIDVHCHLQFKAFAHDCDQVIKDAFKAGVEKIINVGTQISSSEKAVELATAYENLYAIIGVHPHHADKEELDHEGNWLEKLETLAKNKKVVAIGEIGLDNYRYKSNGIANPAMQKEIFIKQLELAHKLKLPIQIHNRHGGWEILDILNAHKNELEDVPGMFHCMSGDIAFLKKVLDLGFFVGFDGNATYRGVAPGEDTELKDLIYYAPLERIVTETDSPFLTPEPHRGSRNMPSYVILVAEFIASLKGVSQDVVKAQTVKNARTLFGI